MTDMLSTYLENCSPYILKYNYDLEQREVVITCAGKPNREIRFMDVLEFSEQPADDFTDDNLTDSIIGIHKLEENAYCVHTEKRELIIRTNLPPISNVAK